MNKRKTSPRKKQPQSQPRSSKPRPHRGGRKGAPSSQTDTRAGNADDALEMDQLLAELETLRQSQFEIENSQQLYAEHFDLSPVGYLNLTPRGQIQNANLSACDLLKRPRNHVVGAHFNVFVARDDLRKFTDHLRRCKNASGELISTELQLVVGQHDLPYVELISRNSTLVGTDDVIYRTVVNNITARVTARVALRESEERFRNLADSVPSLIWINNLDGCEYVNQQYLDFLGVPDLDVRNYDWVQFIHPEDREPYVAAYHDAMSKQELFEAQFRFRRHDGVYRWMKSIGTPLRSDTGELLGCIGSTTDITDIHQAQLELRESREQLHLIFENTRDFAIISLDREHRVTIWNIGAERLLGYTEQEMIGRKCDIIFVPEDREAGVPEREVKTAMKKGSAADERWHMRKDGSRFWGSGVMTAMHDSEGEIAGFVKIFRDQTEVREARMQLEESREQLWKALQEKEKARADLEAASTAKDHFLAVLSHELRTPLTPILMATNVLLRTENLGENVREGLEMIRRNVQLQNDMISDLLDVTRIARGKLEIVHRPLDILATIRCAAEVTQETLKEKDQRLVLDIPGEEFRIIGDFNRLEQVFWNLIKNASKFSPERSEIRVSAKRLNDRIRISVADSGIGISKEVLPVIFGSFSQGGQHITSQYGGLGLGLAICKATVEAHGGRIFATSEGEGKGAAFTVELNLDEETG